MPLVMGYKRVPLPPASTIPFIKIVFLLLIIDVTYLNILKATRKCLIIFYYRFPGGEAASDVYDRINDLLGSLHRDFTESDFPENCVLITHSLAIRLFIMRWFHHTVEEFECMCSPKNCDLVILEKNIDGHYQLVTPIETAESINMRKRPIRL